MYRANTHHANLRTRDSCFINQPRRLTPSEQKDTRMWDRSTIGGRVPSLKDIGHDNDFRVFVEQSRRSLPYRP